MTAMRNTASFVIRTTISWAKENRIAAFMLAMAFVSVAVQAVPREWDVIDIEPFVESPLLDGTSCSKFVHRNGVEQLICFRSKKAKLGPFHWDDIVPAYYVQDGEFRELF